MRTDSYGLSTGAPPQERAILDQIRDDHELVARLKITPQELGALSKCSLLGTLTCKEDMLFILREIREATSSSSSGQMPPYSEDEEQGDPLSDLRQVQGRFAPEIMLEPDSLEGFIRRRPPEWLAILFLVAIIAVALFWNGIIAMSRCHAPFTTKVGMPISHAAASEVWLYHLDRFSVLLSCEILVVVGIIGMICIRSLRGRSRFKVRPGWSYSTRQRL
jgi:hypothetical protein